MDLRTSRVFWPYLGSVSMCWIIIKIISKFYLGKSLTCDRGYSSWISALVWALWLPCKDYLPGFSVNNVFINTERRMTNRHSRNPAAVMSNKNKWITGKKNCFRFEQKKTTTQCHHCSILFNMRLMLIISMHQTTIEIIVNEDMQSLNTERQISQSCLKEPVNVFFFLCLCLCRGDS